jgi:phosphatidylinositol-3-phosphatase
MISRVVGPLLAVASALPAFAQVSSVKKVFVIVLENHNWSTILRDPTTTYIKGLLPKASYAKQYFTPPRNHPSEPNYLWMESGKRLSKTDSPPSKVHHLANVPHLTALLDAAGKSWKSYQEDIDGKTCPLANVKNYVPKHNPFVFFDDVTEGLRKDSAKCIAHIRPFQELAADLASNRVADYNFITPNMCHDMHDDCGKLKVRSGDEWLRQNVPVILASQAYSQGALFITWDEGDEFMFSAKDGPIGLILLSPFGKGDGYSNSRRYTHSSLLKTLQDIFAVQPYLGDAAKAENLNDLFRPN